MKAFKSTADNSTVHLVDNGGNHFIGTRCQNPLVDSPALIGSTIPKDCFLFAQPEVTGFVPHLIDEDGRFVRL